MANWLDYVIFLVGSGFLYFIGTIFVLGGLALSLLTPRKWLAVTRNLVVFIGCLLIAISAAPLEWWIYTLMTVIVGVWMSLKFFKQVLGQKPLFVVRWLVLVVILLAMAMELQFHIMPSLPVLVRPTIFLIGDSISAGTSESDKETWPKLFAQQHKVDVRNFSRMGATVKSACRQAENLRDQNGLVLLEIGGNDLLGGTSPEDFEKHLNLLLADVCRPKRTVLMLALPLPPFANRFGLAQRRLAGRYSVILVPQRFLAELLTSQGSTVDGIHLTPKGNQRMADMVWGMVKSAYE